MNLQFKTLILLKLTFVYFASISLVSGLAYGAEPVLLGPRPLFLVDLLPDGALKSRLNECKSNSQSAHPFSIGHRGAPLQFPEHTRESYLAAARMGAGKIECDVSFTQDQELVCRHSQCDLHTTTNILQTPLARKCSVPPNDRSSTPYQDVKCCTSDITVAEFKTLKGKMDSANRKARSLEDYLAATASYRTELYSNSGTLMTHRESIELFKQLDVQMVPELKVAEVDMPFGGYTQEHYAQAFINDYLEAGVDPSDVFAQSFSLDDVIFWLDNTPRFGEQAMWLDGRYRDRSFNSNDSSTWNPSMEDLAELGVTTLAPPIWMLLTLDENNAIVPSAYAKAAKKVGLKLVTWTLERSGPLIDGGGWYYQTVKPSISSDSDIYRVLDVLAQQVQVDGVFSDWPATTTYYANCMNPHTDTQ